MGDISPSKLRGFLIPYDLDSSDIWTAEKNYTEADQVAGIPVPDPDQKIIIESRGSQTETVMISTQKAGTPGQGAGFYWNRAGVPNGYGQFSTSAQSNFKTLQRPFGGKTYVPGGSVVHDDGTIIHVFVENDTLTDKIMAYKLSPGASIWSSPVTISSTGLFSYIAANAGFVAASCCMLEDETILAVWIYHDTSRYQMAAARSLNKGASWETIGEGLLPEAIPRASTSIESIQIKQFGGQVLCLVEIKRTGATFENTCLQLVSVNSGASYTQVSDLDENEGIFRPSIIVDRRGFGVSYILKEALNVGRPIFYRLPHAFFTIKTTAANAVIVQNNNAGTWTGAAFTAGQHASFVDEDGNLFTIWQQVSTGGGGNLQKGNGSLWMSVSMDSGATWQQVGNSIGDPDQNTSKSTIFNVNQHTIVLKKLSGTHGQGRFWVFFSQEVVTSPSTNNNGLNYFVLGNYSDVTPQGKIINPQIYQNLTWWHTYLPIDVPQEESWDDAGTGTETIGLSGFKLETLPANQRAYTLQASEFPPEVATSQATGLVCRFVVQAISGGLTSSKQRFVSFQMGSLLGKNEVELRIGLSSMVIYDVEGSATLATVSITGSALTTTGIEILLSIANNKMSLWWRPDDHLGAKGWNAGLTGGTLANGINGAMEIVFGHSTSSAGLETYWREFCVSSGSSVGENTVLALGFTNPDHLQPILYPEFGNYRHITSSLQITTKDSPAYLGDEWQIAPRSNYPIDNIFYSSSPSPQNVWRSNSVVSGPVPSVRIPLMVDPNGEEIKFESDLFGLFLSNINFKNAVLEGYDVGSASWQIIASISTSISGQLDFTRKGNRIYGTGPKNPYFFNHELKGNRAQVSGGGPNYWYEISKNSEGSWGAKGGTRGSVIEVSGTSASDPTGGGAWKLEILSKKVAVAVSLNGATFSAIALTISGQETKEKFFQIGNMSFGPIHVLAPQYSRGRKIAYEANTQEFEQSDGIIRSRSLGLGRKTYTISWAEPIDTSNCFPYDGNPEPNYYKSSTSAGSEAVAAYGGLPFDFLGFLAEREGANKPIIYLPSIPFSSSPATDIRVLKRSEEAIFCKFPDVVSLESVLGDEFASSAKGEIYRIATLNLTEII